MPWFGHRILRGEIPYRDFFLHLPPLHPLAEAALEALVGKSIAAGHLAGAAGHVLMAAVCAGWLARRFRPATAVVCSLAALVLACSDDTEILDLYNPHAALAAVTSGWLACVALDGKRHANLAAWGSGIAAGIAFWTKQTVGLGATVAVPIALALFALRSTTQRGDLSRLVARFTAGWSSVALPLGGWLAANGALDDFVRQVFLHAVDSKGSPLRLMLQTWMAPFALPGFARPAVLAAALVLTTILLVRLGGRSSTSSPRPWIGSAIGLAVCVVLVELASMSTESSFRVLLGREWKRTLIESNNLGVMIGMYGSTLLASVAAVASLRRQLSRIEQEIAIFAFVSAGIALTQSLSFAANEASAFPALALVASAGIDMSGRRFLARLFAFVVALITSVSLLSGATIHKLKPFTFAGWKEPARWQATVKSAEPALAGLRLSRETVEAVDGVLAAIRSASDPGESILTFPVYPIFYWLGDRAPVGLASVHWIDVTPDWMVDSDIERVSAARPVVVVRQSIPAAMVEGNEAYFRSGHESGMRRMNDFLDRLLAESYRLTYRAPRRREYRYPPIEVWVRSDRVAERSLQVLERRRWPAGTTRKDRKLADAD